MRLPPLPPRLRSMILQRISSSIQLHFSLARSGSSPDAVRPGGMQKRRLRSRECGMDQLILGKMFTNMEMRCSEWKPELSYCERSEFIQTANNKTQSQHARRGSDGDGSDEYACSVAMVRFPWPARPGEGESQSTKIKSRRRRK